MNRGFSGIHLWMAPLPGELSSAQQARWLALLSPDEQQRWQRFRQERDRQSFLLGKVLTRSVLAECLARAPGELAFTTDAHGKPRLLEQPGKGGLRFNLSHTPGMAVLAVTDGVEPGVDVESFARRVEALALARRYFASPEVAALEELQGQALQEHFIRLWTLKEAWLKAKGHGLREPLDAFHFVLQGQSATVAFSSLLDEDPARWQLRLYRQDGFCIALALHAARLQEEPVLHQWNDR